MAGMNAHGTALPFPTAYDARGGHIHPSPRTRTGRKTRQQARISMAPENFLHEYVEEVREHLQELENSLLNLERDGTDAEEINQIFRAAHSIKGASAYMGFERLANLTHELESLISEIRKASRPITTDGISVMLECVDFISSAVNVLESNGEEPPLPQALLDGIHSALSGDGREAGAGGGRAAPEDGEGLAGLITPELSIEEVFMGESGESGPFEPPPTETEDEVLVEDDGELFRIYAAAFRDRFSDLVRLFDSGAGGRSPAEVSEAAREVLGQMVLSSQYMDYTRVVTILNEMEESLLKAVPDGNPQDGQGALDRLYAFGLRLQRLLPGVDLPLPVHAGEPEPEPEFPEREEDQELFHIYLDSFHDTFGQIDRFIPADPEAPAGEAEFEGIREVIQRLISSSRYMDYDRVANTLEDLDRDLQEAYGKGRATGKHLAERFNILLGHLKTQLPALGDLHLAIEPADSGPKVEVRGGDFPESMDFLDEIAAQAESLIRELAPEPAPADPGEGGDGAGEEDFAGWSDIFDPASAAGEADFPAEMTQGSDGGAESPAASQPPEKITTGHPVGKSKKTSGQERIYAVAEEITNAPTLRVDAQKVDLLLNQVGELVVTRSEFIQTSQLLREFLREVSSGGRLSKQELRKLRALNFRLNESTQSLGRVANDLQDSVMRVRMLPISFLFQRFHRVVRDHSIKIGKRIELMVDGGETEIDKRVLEQMYDPIVQLLRNAIVHGIETPERRKQMSKTETGNIRLAAAHQGDYVTLEIEDDGNGIDLKKLRRVLEARKEVSARELDRLSEQELLYAIFLPGISTRDEADGNAGRGVGLDVAKENVERMNGSIDVETFPGVGTRFTIRIPLTVAIIRALLVGGALPDLHDPLTAVSEILRYEAEEVHTIEGFEVISLRGKTIPLIHLSQLLNLANPTIEAGPHRSIVIVSTSFREVGLVVDSLLGEREVVIKPLDTDAHDYEGFSGATILGDGTVSLVLDVSSLLRQLKDTFGARRRTRESVLH